MSQINVWMIVTGMPHPNSPLVELYDTAKLPSTLLALDDSAFETCDFDQHLYADLELNPNIEDLDEQARAWTEMTAQRNKELNAAKIDINVEKGIPPHYCIVRTFLTSVG